MVHKYGHWEYSQIKTTYVNKELFSFQRARSVSCRTALGSIAHAIGSLFLLGLTNRPALTYSLAPSTFLAGANYPALTGFVAVWELGFSTWCQKSFLL
mmetsp:Transcript_9280/g.12908  ORF Transcript_9280/g.12908 Transcript_9280/m.12908 type:complete len:98 (+) Transcript_9280:290-583(+)